VSTKHDQTHGNHRYGNTLGFIIFGLTLLLLVACFMFLILRSLLG